MSSPAGGPLRLVLIASACAVALWCALMFALVNGDWVVVRLPTAPWNPDPSVPAFEARLFAVMLASLVAGVAAASLAWWRALERLRRRHAAEGVRSQRMESELVALGRLVSTARDLERAPGGADQTMGRDA